MLLHCTSDSLDDVLPAFRLGQCLAVQWRRVQAFTFAQVRKTLTHVHSHSGRVFTYTLALDGARWRVPWHASIMHDVLSGFVTSGLNALHHRQHTGRRLASACIMRTGKEEAMMTVRQA